MSNSKYWFWAGIALLLLGTVGLFFSQLIIEDWLQIERPFGEEPLSIKYIRAGGIAFLLGVAFLLYGGWRNWRVKQAQR